MGQRNIFVNRDANSVPISDAVQRMTVQKPLTPACDIQKSSIYRPVRIFHAVFKNFYNTDLFFSSASANA